MQENLRLIRVFIGSPGGLEKERQAAHDVVKEINQHNSDHWGSLFKLMGWEEAIPGYQRAQDKINEDLDRCEYFIGVMWDKWGSKPSNDPNGYTSGFEEEYVRSARRIETGLMKDMALFFKKVEVPPGMEAGREIQRVLDFRKKCIDEKKIFFRDFNSIDSFKDAIRAKLMEIGWQEYSEGKIGTQETNEEDQPPLAENETEISSSTSYGLLDEEAKSFLADIIQRPEDWDATEPGEIARFRLISASVSRSGNDEAHLGTHDANLVFRHYRDTALSDQEYAALIDCGVVGFEHQNVPLWRWLAKSDMGDDYLYRLRLLATAGSNSEKVGAIRILQSLGSPIPTHDGYFNKTGVLTDWLSEETDARVLNAVVSFLGTNASEDDIPLIEEASAALPSNSLAKVEAAIVEIIAGRSVEDALNRVCEQNVSNIGSALAAKLMSNQKSLTTITLKSCLSAKPDAIRVYAAKILHARGEITEEIADTLLTDDNAEIRLIGAEVLRIVGKELNDDVLEKVLKVQKTGGIGLLGRSDYGPDTTQLEIYRANRRAELDASKLVKMAEDDFLQYKCLVTLFEQYSTKASQRIRQGLEDHFSEYFERSTASFRSEYGSDQNFMELLEQVIPKYRNELLNSAVQALCRLSKPEDVGLVRKCIDTLDLEAHENLFQFLARYGEWQDIKRILELGLEKREPNSLLSITPTSFPTERAAALLSLGKDRIADLLALKIEARIRKPLVKQIPNSTFKALPDDLILRELVHPNADCRAIAALRCVKSFPKARVTALLNSYIDNEDSRFYNCIHWLDLGVSLPSQRSKVVAGLELDRR
ncbi:DUF4062 domain-containing protein [Ruegeria arenilitoris]|uniref:DUF4062 domain-containing protein n=1 Tax=Ruegeria arenilitoris TaxID=1173585 RepID=UPI0014798466|nr:DUF4062 domain-containing protein [Ruegeria arenilitoris]